METSSNLTGLSSNQIVALAQNIASETFVKHGNKYVAFNENQQLRTLVGGRWTSYPELSKLVVTAYNETLSTLILSNI